MVEKATISPSVTRSLPSMIRIPPTNQINAGAMVKNA